MGTPHHPAWPRCCVAVGHPAYLGDVGPCGSPKYLRDVGLKGISWRVGGCRTVLAPSAPCPSCVTSQRRHPGGTPPAPVPVPFTPPGWLQGPDEGPAWPSTPIGAHTYRGRLFVPQSSGGTLEPLGSTVGADRLPCPLPKDSGTSLLLEGLGTLYSGCARDTIPGAVPWQVHVGEGTPSRAWRGAALQGAVTGHSGLTMGGGCFPLHLPGCSMTGVQGSSGAGAGQSTPRSGAMPRSHPPPPWQRGMVMSGESGDDVRGDWG